MALPNKDDLDSLDYAYLGEPFINIEAKSLNTQNLDYAYLGEPFVGATVAAAPPTGAFTVYGKVAGVWQQASEIHTKVGGSWKVVTEVYVKDAGVWKSAT